MDPYERRSENTDRVQRLTPRGRRLLRLIATGMPVGVAAEQCLLTTCRASMIYNSELGREYIAEVEGLGTKELMEENAKLELRVRESIVGTLLEEAPDTLDRLLELRDGDDARVALSASKDLLDRAGYKPKEQIEVEGKVLADPGLAEALKRLCDLSKASEPDHTLNPSPD